MKLRALERMLLSNQMLILEKLCPERAKEIGLVRKALQNGYESHYAEAIQSMGRGLAAAAGEHIVDILQMHKAILFSYQRVKPKGMMPDAVRFEGFSADAEHEVEALSYTRFLVNDAGQFRELTRPFWDLSSGRPMLPRYELMLAAWKMSKDKEQLAEADIRRVVNAPTVMTRV